MPSPQYTCMITMRGSFSFTLSLPKQFTAIIILCIVLFSEPISLLYLNWCLSSTKLPSLFQELIICGDGSKKQVHFLQKWGNSFSGMHKYQIFRSSRMKLHRILKDTSVQTVSRVIEWKGHLSGTLDLNVAKIHSFNVHTAHSKPNTRVTCLDILEDIMNPSSERLLHSYSCCKTSLNICTAVEWLSC